MFPVEINVSILCKQGREGVANSARDRERESGRMKEFRESASIVGKEVVKCCEKPMLVYPVKKAEKR